jgi:23S rRNA (adenine2030-N6)-methyltransferase
MRPSKAVSKFPAFCYCFSMLSYRHGFHAGNHADVLKHAALSLMLKSLGKKDKPFTYLESHAGAGFYALDSEWAAQTGEAEAGILRLLERGDAPAGLKPYLELCRKFNAEGRRYPGSPCVAQAFCRAGDRLCLMELHNTEIDALRANLGADRRVSIHHREGYAGLLALTPPDPRRGLALIDPSYELGEDYPAAAACLIATRRGWPAGIIALWYPRIVRREAELAGLFANLRGAKIEDTLRVELGVRPYAGSTGLVGSGLLIINPPWKLDEELGAMLPWLAKALGEAGAGNFSLDYL